MTTQRTALQEMGLRLAKGREETTMTETRDAADDYLGCGDGSCVFGPPKGQHTNGGCRCFKSLDDRQQVTRVRRATIRLAAENARLREQLDALAEAATAHEGVVHVDQDELEALRAKAALADANLERLWQAIREETNETGVMVIQEAFDALEAGGAP